MFCGLQLHHLRSRVRADQFVMFISDIPIMWTPEVSWWAGKMVRRALWIGGHINPFNWLASNQTRFPSIAVVARQYLAIPATSVAIERLFWKCGLIYVLIDEQDYKSSTWNNWFFCLKICSRPRLPVKSWNKLTLSDRCALSPTSSN